MKRTSAVILGGAILLLWLRPAESEPSGPELLPQEFATAWNSHSTQAFERLFTMDADWVTTYDTRDEGRANIVADLKDAHESFAKDTSVKVSKIAVRHLRPDVAVVHFNADLRVPGGQDQSAGRTMLFVAVKQGNSWKIASGQITKPNCP